jgi:hypothetical protein
MVGFIWSQATSGTVALTRAQVLMLLKGIEGNLKLVIAKLGA